MVTLIEAPNVCCKGMAYRVSPDVFAHLDVREKNGYLRFATPMMFADGTREDGLVYIASEGPSGRNRDYLLNLATALRALGDDDPHVFALESYLR